MRQGRESQTICPACTYMLKVEMGTVGVGVSRDADTRGSNKRQAALMHCSGTWQAASDRGSEAGQGRAGMAATQRGAELACRASPCVRGRLQSCPWEPPGQRPSAQAALQAGRQAGGLEGNIRTRMLAVLLTQPSSATQPAAGRQTPEAEWAAAGAGAPTQPTPPHPPDTICPCTSATCTAADTMLPQAPHCPSSMYSRSTAVQVARSSTAGWVQGGGQVRNRKGQAGAGVGSANPKGDFAGLCWARKALLSMRHHFNTVCPHARSPGGPAWTWAAAAPAAAPT